MPSYETLDAIADAYNPLLFICVILTYVSNGRFAHRKLRYSLHCIREIVAMLILVYVTLMVDKYLSLWPRFGLDYSTHTALAAVLCFLLWQHTRPPIQVIWPVSLLGYCILMDYQNYHTWGDMISTLLYIAAAVAAIVPLQRKFPATFKAPSLL